MIDQIVLMDCGLLIVVIKRVHVLLDGHRGGQNSKVAIRLRDSRSMASIRSWNCHHHRAGILVATLGFRTFVFQVRIDHGDVVI